MARASVKVSGKKIESLRQKKLWERKDLAELAGISAHRLYMIERHTHSTSPTTARRIQLALGASYEQIQPEASAVDPASATPRAALTR